MIFGTKKLKMHKQTKLNQIARGPLKLMQFFIMGTIIFGVKLHFEIKISHYTLSYNFILCLVFQSIQCNNNALLKKTASV